MTTATLVNWGFIKGESQMKELIKVASDYKLNQNCTDDNKPPIEHVIKPYIHDQTEIMTGDHKGQYPVFVFGQVASSDNPASLSSLVVTSMVSFVGKNYTHVITISGSTYHLKGLSFCDRMKYNQSHCLGRT